MRQCGWCRHDRYHMTRDNELRCPRCGDVYLQPMTAFTLRPFALVPVAEHAVGRWLERRAVECLRRTFDVFGDLWTNVRIDTGAREVWSVLEQGRPYHTTCSVPRSVAEILWSSRVAGLRGPVSWDVPHVRQLAQQPILPPWDNQPWFVEGKLRVFRIESVQTNHRREGLRQPGDRLWFPCVRITQVRGDASREPVRTINLDERLIMQPHLGDPDRIEIDEGRWNERTELAVLESP